MIQLYDLDMTIWPTTPASFSMKPAQMRRDGTRHKTIVAQILGRKDERYQLPTIPPRCYINSTRVTRSAYACLSSSCSESLGGRCRRRHPHLAACCLRQDWIILFSTLSILVVRDPPCCLLVLVLVLVLMPMPTVMLLSWWRSKTACSKAIRGGGG